VRQIVVVQAQAKVLIWQHILKRLKQVLLWTGGMMWGRGVGAGIYLDDRLHVEQAWVGWVWGAVVPVERNEQNICGQGLWKQQLPMP